MGDLDRRQFIAVSAGSLAALAAGATGADGAALERVIVDDFDRPDSSAIGDGWESLNPGYWRIEGRRLRRQLRAVGDRARGTGFPYHYETHGQAGGVMPVKYDPSLPTGIVWRRDWRLDGDFELRLAGQILADPTEPCDDDDEAWRQFQPWHPLIGLAVGGRSQFEGFGRGNRAVIVGWLGDGRFGFFDQHPHRNRKIAAESGSPGITEVPRPSAGQTFTLSCAASGGEMTARLDVDGARFEVSVPIAGRAKLGGDLFGIAARGRLDVAIARLELESTTSRPVDAPVADCQLCYALGPTLRREGQEWHVTFVTVFRSDGERADLRVTDVEEPEGGWLEVPVAGTSRIVNNDFRARTAVVDVRLPYDPAERAMYYTVWKDGVDVTADPRIGTETTSTASVGPGTGCVGEVPKSGTYVGRLPRLTPPYRLCGLSCHAIHGGEAELPEPKLGGAFGVRDQPTPRAFAHLEEYDFQVMLWEDDVWYLELLMYPPSPEDAYKIITTTLGGPTTRWQMMRHWNVINPGDHDHGMDDVKGPEQLALRARDDLGQDPDYMRRNFQIVSHLISGDESPDPRANPKRWRRWSMPRGDFSLVVVDARLWRSSQDTRIWDDEGWGHVDGLYRRDDPTRSLLGEEQFAWLTEVIRTDPATWICVTGINGLHTIWSGVKKDESGRRFAPRDRVAADYAGWVKAGCDRVIELLSSRPGVVSVYGDVHVGSIVRNRDHRLYECSFGPIGRTGGRRPKEEFGPTMVDYDGRPVDAIALYHQRYQSPKLEPRTGPQYWNFLEAEFDPRDASHVRLQVRNLIDAPGAEPRGGGTVDVPASETGRQPTSWVPRVTTLPDAQVLVSRLDGRPLRGARADARGTVGPIGLVDVAPGSRVIVRGVAKSNATADVVVTVGG